MKKSIAIDMDYVLVHIEGQMIEWYEKKYGLRIDDCDMNVVPEGEAFPDKDKVKQFLFTPGFFRTASIIDGAQEAVEKLCHDYEVYIVSAAMEFPQLLSEKREWLEEYFPFINWRNIIFCGDKSIIDTDFMIADHLKNLNFFKGQGILFIAGHNINLDYEVRVNNWNEALLYLY